MPTDASAKSEADSSPDRNRRKIVVGKVTSAKMQKTISVKIERREPHPLYSKIMRKFTTVKAHDEEDEARAGDVVELMETRPTSKTKRWRLLRIVRVGAGARD